MEKIQNRKKRKKSSDDKSAVATVESGTTDKKKIPSMIAEGDMVKLQGQPVPGEVIEIRGNEALVAFGYLMTQVKITRLERLSQKACKKEMRQDSTATKGLAERIREKKLNFKADIDVRGMRAEEAINLVVSHLDEAVLCGASKVKILHGKGTGILRQLIREQLNTIPFVRHFADEDLQFGGAGITVVDLE
jgi:DNA mismatch repair protein MutS2